MGMLMGAAFAHNAHVESCHNYGLEYELSKQNALKKEENNLKELELKIKQYEKYTDEELIEKASDINPEEEFDVVFKISGGMNNKVLHMSKHKDKIKNTQEFKDLQDEVIRRGLLLNNSKN